MLSILLYVGFSFVRSKKDYFVKNGVKRTKNHLDHFLNDRDTKDGSRHFELGMFINDSMYTGKYFDLCLPTHKIFQQKTIARL